MYVLHRIDEAHSQIIIKEVLKMSQKLTQKQLNAISMLVEGSSVGLVALSLKLRRETVSRWQRIPEFKEEYTRLTNEMRLSIKDQITDLFMVTIKELRSSATSTDSDPRRIQALLNIIKTLGTDINVVKINQSNHN